ncbi:hypothetical protein [Thermococcus sp.]
MGTWESLFLERKSIVITRELSSLDRFVIDVAEFIEHFTDYVIVSGYVPIMLGRSRGTEDIDFIVRPMAGEVFYNMCKTALKQGFEFINPEDCKGLYKMLQSKMAIRMARSGTIIPNAKIKFSKDSIHNLALENRIRATLNGHTLYISPIELQIAYKLYLGSEKDFEDALFLYELFKEKLDMGTLHEYARKLGVEVPF